MWFRDGNLKSYQNIIISYFKVGWGFKDNAWGSCTLYHLMHYNDIRNKNIYGLVVGISTVFKIFGHFLFEVGRDHSCD